MGYPMMCPKFWCKCVLAKNEELAELAVGKSTIPRGGTGVHAKEPINSDEYITEYRGEVISDWDAKKL